MTREGDILTVKIDLSKNFGPSASGKTLTVASTEGNVLVPDEQSMNIGINVYKKKPA